MNRLTLGQSINTGDVVKLRSGGPHMTVVLVEGDMVDCFWICDHKTPQNYILPMVCLELVP